LVCDVPAVDAVIWCAEDHDDPRTIHVFNTARHPVTVHGDVDRLVDVDDPSEIAPIAAEVRDWTSEDRILLGPDARALFEVPADDEAVLASRFDGPASDATKFAVYARAMSEITDLLPDSDHLDFDEVLEAVDANCLQSFDGDPL